MLLNAEYAQEQNHGILKSFCPDLDPPMFRYNGTPLENVQERKKGYANKVTPVCAN